MQRALLTAASLLGLTGVSAAADPVTIASTRDGDLAAIRSLLPADHPEGVKATVTLVSLKRAPSPYDPTLSAFIVDYAPGGSAVLHDRAPGCGVRAAAMSRSPGRVSRSRHAARTADNMTMGSSLSGAMVSRLM